MQSTTSSKLQDIRLVHLFLYAAVISITHFLQNICRSGETRSKLKRKYFEALSEL